MHARLQLLLTPLLGLLLGACPTSGANRWTGAEKGADGGAPPSGSGAGTDGGTQSSNAHDPAESVIGAFLVQLSRATASGGGADTTRVVGAVKDRPTPARQSWSTAAEDGDCVVLKPVTPSCIPACTNPDVCVADGKCQTWPSARNVGTVTVTGIKTLSGESSFPMQPAGASQSYQPDVELQFPGFAEGDAIRFQTSGGDFDPFTVTSSGISPLALEGGDLTLVRGQNVEVGWTPAGRSGISKIHVKLDISHHGGTKGMIVCDTEDTGSLSISGMLVGKLLDLGVAGWPTIVVTRSSSGAAALPVGRVTLEILSEVEREVLIPGFKSCLEDADCPKGQTCQGDLSCK
jgi:hypothetical protein